LGLILACGQPIASAQPRDTAASRATAAADKSGNKTQSPTKKWALLIGVNDYVQGGDLKYAVNDQVVFSRRLVEAGFSGKHIFSLLSGAKNAKDQPFKRNIEIRLQTVTGLADEGDFVLVAFSGHGVYVNGESYICPADADPKSPKTTMIKVAEIYKALNKSKAAFKLIVVDACRNIPLGAEKRSLVDEKKSLRGFAKTLAAAPRGILVLSSSAVGQVSYEDPRLKLGVFMAYLQYGLTGVADKEQGDGDGQVSLLELYKYASNGTRLFVAKEHGTLQTPSLHGDITGDFVIGTQPAVRIVTNSIDMKLSLIAPGDFVMGSPGTEKGRDADETRHRVKLTKPFYLGVHEVTQEHYERVTGKNPSEYKGPQNPVEHVSWEDAMEFCRRLSVLPAEKKKGFQYRLPTEAEWEYACRAGSTTARNFGDEETELIKHGWLGENSGGTPHPVGEKRPNSAGLFDMYGNVWEWCQDRYGEYPRGQLTNPQGSVIGPERILRGGSWYSLATDCRSAYRYQFLPGNRSGSVGFRVVGFFNK